ncbi:MAG TPA: phage baseplate assembly protein [Xanthobacteraceae bacterium]|nr:phage baseplate assembly protein [Xanthobacteraceae bacterium]
MSFEIDEALRGVLRRARITAVNDDGTQQFVDLSGLRADKPRNILRVQQHGLSSNPPSDAELVLMGLGGAGDRQVALGGEHREHRPKGLPSGGTALYDAHGKILKMVEDSTEFDAGGKPVTIKNASTVRIEGAEDVAIGVGTRWVRIRPHRIDLAVKTPTEQADHKMVTEAGPSDVIWGRID